MNYSFEHVVAECLDDKLMSRTAPRDQYLRDYDFYKGCWDSLNKWIESRLRKNKGASIGNFGTFTWDFREIDGEKQCRPIFLIADSFVKDHNVQQPKTRSVPNVSKSEEINYSKLAIKFSKALTKDMIYSGLRDIFHKIGEYVDRSYEFEIEFSFGSLLSKERRVRFDFNFLRLTHILPENMVGEARAAQTGVPLRTQSVNSSERALAKSSAATSTTNFSRSTSHAGKKLPKMEVSNNITSNFTTSVSKQDLTLDLTAVESQMKERDITSPRAAGVSTSDHQSLVQMDNRHALNIDLGFGGKTSSNNRPISPGLQELLQSMDPPSPLLSKKERQSIACQSVSDQAFRRCLFSVEEQAKMDAELDIKIQQRNYELMLKEKAKREKQIAEINELKNSLKYQIEESQRRRALPPVVSDTSLQLDPSSEILIQREENKNNLLKQLNKQIEDKKKSAEDAMKRKLAEESRFLEHVAMEFDLQNTIERANHLEKQRALLEDWERAAHIRNLQKLKGTDVVHNYVTTNFAGKSGRQDSDRTPMEPESSTSRNSSRGFGISVGYDSRR